MKHAIWRWHLRQREVSQVRIHLKPRFGHFMSFPNQKHRISKKSGSKLPNQPQTSHPMGYPPGCSSCCLTACLGCEVRGHQGFFFRGIICAGWLVCCLAYWTNWSMFSPNNVSPQHFHAIRNARNKDCFRLFATVLNNFELFWTQSKRSFTHLKKMWLIIGGLSRERVATSCEPWTLEFMATFIIYRSILT